MPTSPDPLDSIRVRKLGPDDDRSSFRSGDVDLDRFFARYAGQSQFKHHIGTTYVAVDSRGYIKGFATVTASELAPRTVSSTRRGRLPGYPLPVLRLARLAVDERSKGRGVGALLLRAVFALARTMADDLGCVGTIVAGIVGSIAGGFLATLLGFGGFQGFDVYSLLLATLGAILFLFLLRLFSGGKKKKEGR